MHQEKNTKQPYLVPTYPECMSLHVYRHQDYSYGRGKYWEKLALLWKVDPRPVTDTHALP